MQRGTVVYVNNAYSLRYYERVEGQRVRRVQRLGSFTSKTLARKAADDFMQTVNALAGSPVSPNTTLGIFWDESFLPYITTARRPSTVKGYAQTWHAYLEPNVADMRLVEFQTYHGEKLMKRIASQHELSHNTLLHIKATMLSVFKQAKRLGAILHNPIRDVEVPAGHHETVETYAYSLAEVVTMIRMLPEPASTIVAVAAYAGLRRSEIRGLRWHDYDGSSIRLERTVWNSSVGELKTKASRGVVPVIAPLRDKLDAWRKLSTTSDIMFPSETGTTPLSLDNVRNRAILPILKRQATLRWHGWHAFRRGLATNLKSLGVDDKVIQGILRHAQITTTQNIYMKSAGLQDAHNVAMQKLEHAVTTTRSVN